MITPAALLVTLTHHEPADAGEATSLARIRALLAGPDDPFARTTLAGHVTGSAIVARPDGSTFLLVRHRKLGRWLQPGGHVDPADASVLDTAVREVREETGITDARAALAGRVLDVDVHPIPARPDEPAHAHFDLRYLLTTAGHSPLAGAPDEVTAVAWLSFAEAVMAGADESLVRALRKAHAILARRPG